jgi:hypothetical protein
MTFLDLSRPKARKRHRCVWCGEWIEVGETHVRAVGVYYGDFQSDRFHDECDKASRDFFRENEEFDPGSFKRGTCDEKTRA